jgi:hypothetical protein
MARIHGPGRFASDLLQVPCLARNQAREHRTVCATGLHRIWPRLHISNINEIEHLVGANRSWKTAQNGISARLIAIHGVLFCLTLIGGDVIDRQAIMYCLAIIALASLGLSYSLFNRISRIHLTHPERSP